MASLPLEILYGIYLGVLVGIVPTLAAWALGFVFRYMTGVTIPGLAVVTLAVAIAGANGGLLALNDPTLTLSENQVRLTVALLVVLMMALYAHAQGDKLGLSVPKRMSIRELTERTLSTDVIELVGGRGEVTVTVSGEVADIEGYPPMPVDLRTEIRESTWTYPADVPLVELESRVADRLRTEYDLADVSVRLDERARATISAAPPVGNLSKRVPTGKRAVSVRALVPTGLARHDEVTVVVDGTSYDGTVLSVRSGDGGGPTAGGGAKADSSAATDGGDPTTDGEGTAPTSTALPTATGGEGRVTLAVDRQAAEQVLAGDVDRLVVRSRGTRREFELLSLLRRAGKRFRRLTVGEGSPLDGTTLGGASVRDVYGVAVLAVNHQGRWELAPRGAQELVAGDDLYAVGTRERLTAFEEVAA